MDAVEKIEGEEIEVEKVEVEKNVKKPRKPMSEETLEKLAKTSEGEGEGKCQKEGNVRGTQGASRKFSETKDGRSAGGEKEEGRNSCCERSEEEGQGETSVNYH